jgi:hypothetical protein
MGAPDSYEEALTSVYEKILGDGGGGMNRFGTSGYFGPTFSSEQEALLYVQSLFGLGFDLEAHTNLYEHVEGVGRRWVRSYADRKAIEAALKDYL